MRLCICGAVALLAVLVFRTKTVRDAVARLAALWCGASRWARFGVIAFVTGFVLYAGTKTNSPPAGVMMPFLPPLHDGALGDRALPVVVTPEEIAQGWRLVAETNCDADIYAMPDGIRRSPCSMTGGFVRRLAMLRVRFARWAFRCSPCSGQVGFGWGMRPARRAGPTRERF